MPKVPPLDTLSLTEREQVGKIVRLSSHVRIKSAQYIYIQSIHTQTGAVCVSSNSRFSMDARCTTHADMRMRIRIPAGKARASIYRNRGNGSERKKIRREHAPLELLLFLSLSLSLA